MAAAPRFNIYNPAGTYIGSTVHLEDAACLVSIQGDGATIRDGHKAKDAVFTQGIDGDAGNSYDAAADIASKRILDREAAQEAKRARYRGTPVREDGQYHC